jgi:hypothetical protein
MLSLMWDEFYQLKIKTSHLKALIVLNGKHKPIWFRLENKYEGTYHKTKLNSMVWVREWTIPTERPPPVGEVIANFLRIEGTTWPAWRIPTAVLSVF